MMPKPPLDSNTIDELESHGVDSMRSLLARHDVGMLRNDGIKLGSNVFVKRGEIEDWLRWKAAQDACWIKVGVVAAVLAAIFSLVAVLAAIFRW